MTKSDKAARERHPLFWLNVLILMVINEILGWTHFISMLTQVVIPTFGGSILYAMAVFLVYYFLNIEDMDDIKFFPLSHVLCFAVNCVFFYLTGMSAKKSGDFGFSQIYTVPYLAVLLLFWLIPALIAAAVYRRRIAAKRAKMFASPIKQHFEEPVSGPSVTNSDEAGAPAAGDDSEAPKPDRLPPEEGQRPPDPPIH